MTSIKGRSERSDGSRGSLCTDTPVKDLWSEGPKGAVVMCRSLNQNFNIKYRAPRVEGLLFILLPADLLPSFSCTHRTEWRETMQTTDLTSLVYGVRFSYASPAQTPSGTHALDFNHHVSR